MEVRIRHRQPVPPPPLVLGAARGDPTRLEADHSGPLRPRVALDCLRHRARRAALHLLGAGSLSKFFAENAVDLAGFVKRLPTSIDSLKSMTGDRRPRPAPHSAARGDLGRASQG